MERSSAKASTQMRRATRKDAGRGVSPRDTIWLLSSALHAKSVGGRGLWGSSASGHCLRPGARGCAEHVAGPTADAVGNPSSDSELPKLCMSPKEIQRWPLMQQHPPYSWYHMPTSETSLLCMSIEYVFLRVRLLMRSSGSYWTWPLYLLASKRQEA